MIFHKSHFFKTLAVFLGCFSLVVFAILMVIPSLVSTTWGTKQALTLVNGQIPGTVTAKKLSLNWIGPQTFEDVTLTSLEGETILHFDRFTTDTPLFNFLLSGPTIGKADLEGFYLNIIEEYPQVTNLHQALGTKEIKFGKAKDKVIIHLPFSTEIAVKRKNSPTDFRPPKAIVFENVRMHLDAENFTKPMELVISGNTHQEEIDGEFFFSATVSSGRSDKWIFNRNAEVKVKADIVNFPVDMLDLIMTSDQPKLHGLLHDALGNRLTLKIDQTLNRDDGLFIVHTETPTLSADMQAEMVDGKFSLKHESKIAFKVTPELFDRLSSRSRNTPLLRLVAPAQTLLTIDQLSLPVQMDESQPGGFDVGHLSIEAQFDVEDTNFTGSPFWGDLAIKGVRSTIESQETSEQAEVHLRGEANQNGQPLHIKFDATIKKPLDIKNFFETLRKQTQMQLEVAGVPLVLNGNLEEMSGTVSVNTLSLGNYEFSTESVTGPCRLDLHKGILNLDISGTTQEGGSIQGCLHYSQEQGLTGKLQASALRVREKHKGQSVSLDHLSLACEKNCLSLDVQEKNKGLLHFTQRGDKSRLKLMHFPLSDVLGVLFPKMKVKKKVNALFGEKVQGLITTSGKKVQGHVSGPMGNVFVQGELNGGIVTLDEPLTGHFVVSPQLGKKILGEFVPAFSQVISAEEPLKLQIEPQGFAFDLFHPVQTRVEKAVLEMGKMSFAKSGEIAGLMDLFETEACETVPVWFTPVHFQLKQGVVYIERVDMLFMEEYPLATWGRVDFKKDKVHMVLGLTKEALESAFAIEGLDDGYVMQLPLKGKLKEAKIDKGRSATRIGMLLAKEHTGGKNGFVGTVIDLANGSLSHESKRVPSPTVTSFPWSVK